MDLVAALLDPGAYPEATATVSLVQTHISWVFLTDRFAYKMKKPLDLGFLNFTTLRRRHYYLRQELSLNRRLCPDMYLAVLPVIARRGRVQVGGRGEVLEYVLQMVRLPQERMMDEVAARGELTSEHITRLAAVLAPFYQKAATGPHVNRWGTTGVIIFNHEENFAAMKAWVGELLSPAAFRDIRGFARGFLAARKPLFHRRVREGRIRDGHGDLHMKNICLANGIYVFDCIEFNPRFRYGDVAADMAFLAMDLDFSGYQPLSRRFAAECARGLNDPDLLELLTFYQCYRACVRGKVCALAAAGAAGPPAEQDRQRQEARAYFALAHAYAREGLQWTPSWW